MDQRQVYVAIGNSDGKLSQSLWARFYQDVDEVVGAYSGKIYGKWVSESTSPYQNACWSFMCETASAESRLRQLLDSIRIKYDQDEISWHDVSADRTIKA